MLANAPYTRLQPFDYGVFLSTALVFWLFYVRDLAGAALILLAATLLVTGYPRRRRGFATCLTLGVQYHVFRSRSLN